MALPAQGSLTTPLAQAQQQMSSFLPGKPQIAGQGVRPTGLDAPMAQDAQTQPQPAATPQGHATAVPGMEGTPAANPIDMHGPLDPRGLALDGNHAAGVQKGFKIASILDKIAPEGPMGKFVPKPQPPAYAADVDFVDSLNEQELRDALRERVQMIAQLRAHRDALLDHQSGYKIAGVLDKILGRTPQPQQPPATNEKGWTYVPQFDAYLPPEILSQRIVPYGEDPAALQAFDQQMLQYVPDWYDYRNAKANNDEEADYYRNLGSQSSQAPDTGIKTANQLVSRLTAHHQNWRDQVIKYAEDQIPGGKADDKPDSAFPKDQLRKGQKVEMEHVDRPGVAKEIAKDHLTESNRYYSALEIMEKGLKKEKKKSSQSSHSPKSYPDRSQSSHSPKSYPDRSQSSHSPDTDYSTLWGASE